ncbi:hypothetical protein [Micromonospora yangpuensis]|uniref:Uncharacterized protein n=1 Tax=Micromonospora yangpuensis TaxID=683228 RepID=A0A1C6TY26_9ACTN|nr:hypothetical protein [Micromonospora yangpuensis]GGM02276.1 hypothetical protein GCM10012279_19960 [Micromonospora yangpuensis]SCL46521.1 hypothetical protein GA0070617_0298 [Micromonospora yangpuensis]
MVDSQNTPARARPSVVTISSYLILAFAITQVIGLILSFLTIGPTRDAFQEAYQGSDPDGAATLANVGVAFAIGASVLVVLLAVGLFVLAMLNNRGKNWSRITTWVVGGVLVCCSGGGLISGAAGMAGNQSGGDIDTDALQRRLEADLPSWYNGVSMTLSVLGLLALLAALILLALPASNEFFRNKPQGWEPPVPGGNYPGHPQGQPGYPQTPGHPQGSNDPGYPSPSGPPQGSGDPGYPPPGQSPGGQFPPSQGDQGPPSQGDQGPSDRPSGS